MDTVEEVKLGFLGLGWPGEQHAKAAVAVPGGSVYAACDLGAERREGFAAQFSPARVYSRYEDMLADPAVDAIVISLPNFLHASTTMSALQAGKHVLCEKPPTMNVPEMEAIRTEATTRGLTYAFSRQSRFMQQDARRETAGGGGDAGSYVYFARAEWVRSRGIPAGVGGWFTEKKQGGRRRDDRHRRPRHRRRVVSWRVARSHSDGERAGGSEFPRRGARRRDVRRGGQRFRDRCASRGGLMMHLEVSWAGNLTDGRAGESVDRA